MRHSTSGSTTKISDSEQFADPDGHKLSSFNSTSVSGAPTGSLLTFGNKNGEHQSFAINFKEDSLGLSRASRDSGCALRCGTVA
jgi:hypothetical protein